MQRSKLLSVLTKAGDLIEWCVATFERKCSVLLESKVPGGGKMGKERVSKRKRARGRGMVFNKEAALYGNVMNTVDKKRERQKL